MIQGLDSKAEISKEILETLIILKYADKQRDFEELELTEPFYIHELLNSTSIIYFIDLKRELIWIWYGRDLTTRTKFLAGRIVHKVRDRYELDFRIVAVDDGNEPLGFRIMLGVEDVPNEAEARNKFEYYFAEQDAKLFEAMFKVKKESIEEYTSLLVREVMRRIISIMEKEKVKEISIDREYLPEIFQKEVLGIAGDGLSTIHPFIIERLKEMGLKTEVYGKVIKFILKRLNQV